MPPKDQKDGFERVLDKLDDMQKDISGLDKKIDLNHLENKFEFSQIQKLDEQQNKILDEHSQRSTAIQKDNELREISIRRDMGKIDERVVALEEPKKFRAMFNKKFWKVVGALSLLGGLVLTVFKFLV